MTDKTKSDQQWESIQKRTEKVAAVRGAVASLDVAWHDANVMLLYFKEHSALDAEFKAITERFMKACTDKSDKYQTWLNVETAKLDDAVKELQGE